MLLFIPIILIIVGIIAIILEVFVPDYGILAIIGVSLMISAIIFSFIKFDFPTGLIFLLIVLVLFPVIFIIAFNLFPRSYFGKKLILNMEEKASSGFTVDLSLKEITIGTTGIAVTPCRPSGIGLFNNKKLDVLTVGEYIDKGEKIVITKIEGTKIIVKKL